MTITSSTQMFPNVAWGLIGDIPFFFRARHEEWQLHIAEKGTAPEEAHKGPIVASGTAEYAGGWSETETMQHALEAITAWKNKT